MRAAIVVVGFLAACGDDPWSVVEVGMADTRCSSIAVGNRELIAACAGVGWALRGGEWLETTGVAEGQGLGMVYTDWRDDRIYGTTLDPFNRGGEIMTLNGTTWEPIGIPMPDTLGTPTPALVVGDGTAYIGYPLRRYQPETGWVALDPEGAGVGPYDEGLAITADGTVYLGHNDGLWMIPPGQPGRWLVDCTQTPVHDACVGPDDVPGSPIYVQNGMDGAVYFQSGGNTGFVSFWRVDGGELRLVAHSISQNYGTFSLSVDRSGVIYSGQMIDSGSSGVVLRHAPGDGLEEWQWIVDCASYQSPCLDALYAIEAGPDGRVYAYGPQSSSWSGIYQLTH